MQHQIPHLSELVSLLKKTRDLGEKQAIFLSLPQVAFALKSDLCQPFLNLCQKLSSKIALYALIAIEQHSLVLNFPNPPKKKIRTLLSQLEAIERFYECIGGIVGYHLQVLELLYPVKPQAQINLSQLQKVPGLDLIQASKEEVGESISVGIESLGELAEIYPIGGLGSRLNLLNKKREPLPVACLPFCGRTLLEGLIRDIEAREFLYFRLKQQPITIPVAMMTSYENENAKHIKTLCRKKRWFFRPKESFKLFTQISVPVVTVDGYWSLKAPLELNLQPGGHGALWQSAEENGIFIWLKTLEKKLLLIRQINNPIAGQDIGLLALVGHGKKEGKAFGFASCERMVGSAEGALALMEDEESARVSNIEYTEFKHHSEEKLATLAANTNILYTDLSHILPVIQKNPLPGLILNMKNKVPYLTPQGMIQEKLGGRLESMMQNISDSLLARKQEALPTFITYNERSRTISTAKKSYCGGKELLETPEGAFYDLIKNSYELLKDYCDATLAPFCTPDAFIQNGPSHLFLYHPALGPLYSLIAQKIKKLMLGQESELQLEIADAFLENVKIEGSLLIKAHNLLGEKSQGVTCYSHKTGKCILKNVTVSNQGIDRRKTTHYWQNKIKRRERVEIILQGHSEFVAEDVTFLGNHTITVPDGERWVAQQQNDGTLKFHVEAPSWVWYYEEGEKGRLYLKR